MSTKLGCPQEFFYFNFCKSGHPDLSNESGSISTQCSVRYVRKAPVFVSTPTKDKFEVQAGHPLAVNFAYQGIPVPNPVWSRNGEKLEKNITNQHLHTALSVPEVDASFDGNYTCRIDNEAGFAQYEFSVEIKVPFVATI